MNIATKVTKKTSFLKTKSPDQFIKELTNHFNANALEAYTFGSFNTPTFNTDSDLDLLIVTNTKLNFNERYKLFPELLSFFSSENIPHDLIIYTVDEFKKLTEEGKNSKVGFWSNFIKTHRRIYPVA